jgi:hypothetical protein
METKQTSVEWFYDKIKSHFEHDGDLLETLTFTMAIAKKMERDQIEDAFKHGQNNGFMYHERGFDTISSNQFYKQTYEGKDE